MFASESVKPGTPLRHRMLEMLNMHLNAAARACAFLFGATALFADQITLSNGDRLTGTILRSDAKELVLKTEFVGEVKIKWESITGLTAADPINVELKDGQTIVGSVTQEQDKFRVTTRETGPVTITKEAIVAIRNRDEQTLYETQIERLRNPSVLDLWAGHFDTGIALARGNANTTTFATSALANRVTTRDKIGVTFNQIFATNSTSGAKETTANAVRGGIQYDLNLTKKTYVFGFTTLEFDEFQKLDLRFVVGGGLGHRIIQNERTMFAVFGGGNLNKEFFSDGIRRTSGEALFGEELTHKLNSITAITHKFVIFPNLSDAGEYRMNFDLGAVTKLKNWLSWQITLSDRFLSNPVPGAKKNDVLATTGLRLTFAR